MCLLFRLLFPLIELCSSLLCSAISSRMDYIKILDCIRLLTNPNMNVYASSNKLSHRQNVIWDYLKIGMDVQYDNSPFVVTEVDYCSREVILRSKNEGTTVRVPFYSNEITTSTDVIFETYNDWINDLHYGDVVDIRTSRGYCKGYFAGEENTFGERTFFVNYGHFDERITLNSADPARVGPTNTL